MNEKSNIELKEIEYKQYIEEHISNVKKVWKEISFKKNNEIPWFIQGNYNYHLLYSIIAKHDESKFSYEEFTGYRQWFFPYKCEIKNELKFKNAWNHHQKSNPHHWEYWIMQDGTILEMDILFIIEMLCDWSGMSLKFNDLPSEHYLKIKEKMVVGEQTRKYIEILLPFFDECVKCLNN